MMTTYQTTDVKIGQNKGAPRVWLEGKRLARAGFAPGARYQIAIGDQRVTLTLSGTGARTVSSKQKAEESLPVIDLNSEQTLGVFHGLDRLRLVIRENEIHLLPLATQKKAQERLARIKQRLQDGLPLRTGSLCHGGGILSLALHEGLADAGVVSELSFANDIDPEVLFHSAEVSPEWSTNTIAIASPMQEVVADNWLLKHLGHTEILHGGVPCVAASIAGRAKTGISLPEANPEAGHLVVSLLGIVEALQPAIVIVENVTPYMNTASAFLIKSTLRDWGYQLHETVLEGLQFGALEDRKRMALVAVTQGLSFDMNAIEYPTNAPSRTLADVLEVVPMDASCWSSMDYLRTKEVKDIAAGKGFRMNIVGPEATHVGCLGRGYAKCRSTEAKIRHPVHGDALLRQLTPLEHARVKGIPEKLIEGLSVTRAHELLGNSICFAPFRALGKAIGQALYLSLKPPVFALAA